MTGVPTEAQLRGFVDDLERSLDFDIGLEFDCDDIILCGVGGSAVSGDYEIPRSPVMGRWPHPSSGLELFREHG